MFTDPLVAAIITGFATMSAAVIGQTLAFLFGRKKPPKGYVFLDPRLALAGKVKEIIIDIERKQLTNVIDQGTVLAAKEELIEVLKKELEKCNRRVNKLLGGGR